MPLAIMLLCALAAVLFIGLDVYNGVREVWKHPDHRHFDEGSHWPNSRLR